MSQRGPIRKKNFVGPVEALLRISASRHASPYRDAMPVDLSDDTGWIADIDRDREQIDKLAEALLALPQGLVRPLPFREVPDRRCDQKALVRFQRIQADLDGKLTAIFPARIELSSGPHCAGLRIRHESGTVTGMLSSKTFRQQDLGRLTEELMTDIAEELLGPVVDQHNPTGLVDDHMGIRRRFEQSLELLLLPLVL